VTTNVLLLLKSVAHIVMMKLGKRSSVVEGQVLIIFQNKTRFSVGVLQAQSNLASSLVQLLI